MALYVFSLVALQWLITGDFFFIYITKVTPKNQKPKKKKQQILGGWDSIQ